MISNAFPGLSLLFSYHFHSIVFYSIVFYSILSYHFIFFSSSQVDLLLIESEEFSPELVMQLSLDLKIQPSFIAGWGGPWRHRPRDGDQRRG